MLHELKDIVSTAQQYLNLKKKVVLASVVHLEGSSYRKPGVRMLICEDHTMVGAVSGGCVEKEVLRQAQTVFETDTPKIMVYDGRYRLGCEGILYILIEPFSPSSDFFEAFEKQCRTRQSFSINSQFSIEENNRFKGGSRFNFSENSFWVNNNYQSNSSLDTFTQHIKAGFQLIIIGSEHDAVQLCKYASLTGWEVTIVAPPDDPKELQNFPGASNYLGITENEFESLAFDEQTALVFMTHSYVKDLRYLSKVTHAKVPYIGLLGPKKRREKLLNELIENDLEIPDSFFDILHGPAGLNVGAETPQEIAISIVSEILSLTRKQKPLSLRFKSGGIHQ